MISLHRFTGRQRHVAGLGMFVHPAFHGRGIGTRLMEAALYAAGREWQVARVELQVYPDNEPALRLYRRFGFREEGRLARFAIRDGTYVDAVAMARIRPDLAPCADARREDRAGTCSSPSSAEGCAERSNWHPAAHGPPAAPRSPCWCHHPAALPDTAWPPSATGATRIAWCGAAPGPQRRRFHFEVGRVIRRFGARPWRRPLLWTSRTMDSHLS
ncbi:MAG: GNAT family N-acetyltransferase, partial [Bacillota bacterium]